MKSTWPNECISIRLQRIFCCVAILFFSLSFALSPMTILARPAVVQHRLEVRTPVSSSPVQATLVDTLELSDGSLLITANTSIAGKEGLLVHRDATGKPLGVASIDGTIAQALEGPEGNLLLLQSFPGIDDSASQVWKLSKVTLEGRLLWRVDLPDSVFPRLKVVDGLGNSWLAEISGDLHRITQVDASGKIQRSGALQGDPGASASQILFFDLQVDRSGNAVVAQLEVALQNAESVRSLGVYRLSAAGKIVWSHRQNVRELGFDPAPEIAPLPDLQGVRLAFDSQDRVYLAGSSFYWGNSFFYLTDPRLFVIAFDSDGQVRWTRHTQDPAWKLDPVLVINHADQLVVASSSPNTLVTRTYDTQGALIAQTTLPMMLVDPGSNLVTPLMVKVDAQNNPLLYLSIGYPYRILHAPETTQTRLVKLSAAGDLMWSVTVTNLTLAQLGTEQFEKPRVLLHPDGETRLLGNPQKKSDGSLELDYGGVTSNGTRGRFKKIEIGIPSILGAHFDLCTDRDGNVLVASFFKTDTNGPSNFILTKVQSGGVKAWEVSGSLWVPMDLLRLEVGFTGYTALSYPSEQTGFGAVRLFDPAGVVLWDETTMGNSVLSVGIDGAVYVGKLKGDRDDRRTTVQKIAASGTPIWMTDLPTPEGWIDLRAWETVGGRLVVSWFDPASSLTRVKGLSPTGHSEWNVSAAVSDPSGVMASDGTFCLCGSTTAGMNSGENPSLLTVLWDPAGQLLASNWISGTVDQPTPAWSEASSRGALLRLKSASSRTADAVFYVPQETLATRLIADSRCVPFESDRQASVAALAQSGVSGTGVGQTLGPIFTSLNEAYALVGRSSAGLTRWELVSLALQDGITISPQSLTVFGSATPGVAATLWRTSDLNGPWQPVQTVTADGLGDLKYTENLSSTPGAFFRWANPAFP